MTDIKPTDVLTRASEICARAHGPSGAASILTELAARAPHKSVQLDDIEDDAEVLLLAASICKRELAAGGLALPDGGPALVLEQLAAMLQHKRSMA